jgi:DNA-binding IclR family transcriptional regulator
VTRQGTRKYLPAEGYRFLALLMLEARGERGASKGELAWETRSNHYMATRLLRELDAEGLARVDGSSKDGFTIRITPAGAGFVARHKEYAAQTFAPMLRQHFLYGRIPDWARRVLGDSA